MASVTRFALDYVAKGYSLAKASRLSGLKVKWIKRALKKVAPSQGTSMDIHNFEVFPKNGTPLKVCCRESESTGDKLIMRLFDKGWPRYFAQDLKTHKYHEASIIGLHGYLLPEGHGNLIISPDNGETFYVWRPEFAREFKVVDIRMQDGFVAS